MFDFKQLLVDSGIIVQCSEYGAVYGVRWAIHHLLSTSSSCWKSIMAKPAKESWQVWYWAIKVWCSYLDFSNSIPIPHPLTQNYQPDIKISRDIQPLLHFAVSSNILLTTSILLCHTLWQFCRFVSQHQTYCRLQKEKKRYSGCFFLLCSLRALLEPTCHIWNKAVPGDSSDCVSWRLWRSESPFRTLCR